MGEKKKAKPAADLHRSGFMVRLPESHRAPLAALKAKHRRAMTVEIQIALEKHYRDEKVDHPTG